MNYVYYISLGSNLGNREGYLNQAIEGLRQTDGIIAVEPSSWLETAPWGNTEQGPFLNGVAKVVSSLTPEAMLQCMQYQESLAGRKRVIHWGPRTLDLDIVWAETEQGAPLQVALDHLQIPHPYMWERTFVLIPLQEVYPDFAFQGESINHRIAKLKSADI